eukprot:363917-Chlamydomonas_euryale.AAC.13
MPAMRASRTSTQTPHESVGNDQSAAPRQTARMRIKSTPLRARVRCDGTIQLQGSQLVAGPHRKPLAYTARRTREWCGACVSGAAHA